MKILAIGDFHQVPAELEDCNNLVDYIQAIAEEQKPDIVLFTGDLYHYHNIIRAESLYFWKKVFDRLKTFKIRVLTGNHDLSAENGPPDVHALLAHEGEIEVVDKPLVDGGVLFMPYRHDKNRFIEECTKDVKTLICHQSFDGAKFENGFYDPAGIDLAFMHQKNIISGHIHLGQEFANVHYIGAPRWRIISDANVERNIWIFEFDSKGDVVKRTPFPTSVVCRKIVHFIDEELNPFNLNLFNNKDDFRVDIKGNTAYIEKRTKELKLALPSVKIRPIKTNNEFIKIRESEGIKTAYDKYITNYKPKYGTSLEKLSNLSYSRLGFDQ